MPGDSIELDSGRFTELDESSELFRRSCAKGLLRFLRQLRIRAFENGDQRADLTFPVEWQDPPSREELDLARRSAVSQERDQFLRIGEIGARQGRGAR